MTREPPLPLEWDCASCAALEAEIERLRALVRDLADDLASELRGRYWSPDGTVHPAEQRRYERDMANVYEARRALENKP